MHITDIPIEVVLDNLLPLLPIADLQHFAATNKFFYALCSDETFWKRKLHEDYNFPESDTARTTGWKFIYKRLANPKIYVWG
jgi:SCF-associated factor 1